MANPAPIHHTAHVNGWLTRFVVVWLMAVYTLGEGFLLVEWVVYRHSELGTTVQIGWGAIQVAVGAVLGWLGHRLAGSPRLVGP